MEVIGCLRLRPPLTAQYWIGFWEEGMTSGTTSVHKYIGIIIFLRWIPAPISASQPCILWSAKQALLQYPFIMSGKSLSFPCPWGNTGGPPLDLVPWLLSVFSPCPEPYHALHLPDFLTPSLEHSLLCWKLLSFKIYYSASHALQSWKFLFFLLNTQCSSSRTSSCLLYYES